VDLAAAVWLKLPEKFSIPKPVGHISLSVVGEKLYCLALAGSWSIDKSKKNQNAKKNQL
jgi:hypothetical protein